MKANEAPEKIYLYPDDRAGHKYEAEWGDKPWGEEDDYNLQCMIAKVVNDIHNGNVGRNNELISWLKSIKDHVQPQNHWKPSDEQMKALHDLNLTGNISHVGQGQVLIGLYNDLKKLKGE